MDYIHDGVDSVFQSIMIIGTCIMYRLWRWCTVYLSEEEGPGGHLDWQVLRAAQYVNLALHGWKDNSMLAKPLAACTYLSSIVSELYDA